MAMTPGNDEFSAWWKTMLALYAGLVWFGSDTHMNAGAVALTGAVLSPAIAFLAFLLSSLYLAVKEA